MRSPRARRLRLQTIAIALLAGLFAGIPASARAVSPSQAPGTAERLEKILEQFDATQKETRTLTATFRERKDLALLKEPLVSSGRFYFTRPDQILWQYTEPDPRYFLISKNELLSYHPGKRRAERVSIALYHDRLMRVFAIGQSSSELRKAYDIRLEETGNNLPDTWLLVLEPRKRMVKKRISELRLWVSRDRGLPVQMVWREPDGDTTTLSFEDIRLNPAIHASVYKLDIPRDVTIRRGLSSIGDGRVKEEG